MERLTLGREQRCHGGLSYPFDGGESLVTEGMERL
jgi:hypothetical protein